MSTRPAPLGPKELCVTCEIPATTLLFLGPDRNERTPMCNACANYVNDEMRKEMKALVTKAIAERRTKEACQPSTCRKCKGCKK